MSNTLPRLLILFLCGAVLALGACSQPAPEDGPVPLTQAAEGSQSISNRHFGRQTVPCEDSAATARALLELTSRDLGEGARTRLLDYAIDDVRLRDGTGKIAVIVYAISEEDDEATVTTTEHFLINDSCRVLPWSSAVTPGE